MKSAKYGWLIQKRRRLDERVYQLSTQGPSPVSSLMNTSDNIYDKPAKDFLKWHNENIYVG